MELVRKALRVYAQTLVVFATVHLLIIGWHAFRTGNTAVLTMSDILDIRFLAEPGPYASLVEISLWILLAVVFLACWKRDKTH